MNRFPQNILAAGMGILARQAHQRFIKSTACAQKINEQLLTSLLKLNQDTEYGHRYRFAKLRSAKDFKAALPLTTYADYQAEIERMALGEHNILTAEPVRYFSLSSGTTGQQKLIPITPRSLRRAAATMSLLTNGFLRHHLAQNWHHGRGVNLMNLATKGKTAGGIPTGAATAGGMGFMEKLIPLLWTSPVEMLKSAEDIDATYLHLRFALPEENLAYMCAPFIPALLDMLRYLEKNWPRLVNDVDRGTIDSAVKMPSEVRQALQQRLRPNPRRAAALAAEFEQSWDGIVQRIWPHMLYIGCVAGGSFSIYTKKIKIYTGSLPIYSATYAASEGIIGIGRTLDKPTYLLVPEATYFEFIPLNNIDQAQPETLSLSQLTIGESYEIVLTGFSGLYRYRLADIVRVVGYQQACPEIEFLYRRNQLLNLVGEKTSEQAAQDALQKAFNQVSNWITDFAVMADIDHSPGSYIFFVEIESVSPQLIKHAQSRLERELGRANPSYASARQNGKIGPLELHIVQHDTFSGLKSILQKQGVSTNQLKIPRVIKEKNLLNYLQEQVISVQRLN